MADINKMRPGGTEPDRVLFAKPPKKLKFMFTEWVLNTAAGHDVDVTYDKVVIRKFKPNVWIMHNPSLLNSADSSREVCNYARGTMVSVRGMTAHADIFNAYKTLWSSTGAGGDLPKMRGFCMYPYTHDCEIWLVHQTYWNGGWGYPKGESGNNLPYFPEMNFAGGFRFDGTGRNYYGIFKDRTNRPVFPDELYAYEQYQGYNQYYGFGLYTGNTSAAGEDGLIDISDSPIEIELESSTPNDIGDIECRDAYVGTEQVYHKERTAANYWSMYGMTAPGTLLGGVTNPPYTEYNVGDASRPAKSYNMQPVTDFEAFMAARQAGRGYVSWKYCRPANPDFWAPVKEYYRTVGVTFKELKSANYYQGGGIFAHTGLDELELKITPDETDAENDLFLSAHQLIEGSAIRKLTVNCAPGARLSSLFRLCRNAYSLEELAWEGTPPIAHELSHMFEGSPNIRRIPSCIRRDTTLNGTTNMTVTFWGCSKLERIDCEPGMVCVPGHAPHAFDNCKALTYVEPIFDVHLLKTDEYSAYNTWWGCLKLTHLKLKGIHGVWRLDNSTHPVNNPHTNGHLPALDAECVKYLFDNALAAAEGETCALYCPVEWADKITPEMLTAIKAKGWTVYVGGAEQ